MNTADELAACLVLQRTLDSQWLQLRARYKAVIEAEEAKGNTRRILVTLDDGTYILKRVDDVEDFPDPVTTARKLGGFYMYRLVPVGRMVHQESS